MRRLALAPFAAVLLLSACGDAESSTDTTGGANTTAAGSTVTVPGLVKPTVSLPAELPTELQITDLSDGSPSATRCWCTTWVFVRPTVSSSTTATTAASRSMW